VRQAPQSARQSRHRVTCKAATPFRVAPNGSLQRTRSAEVRVTAGAMDCTVLGSRRTDAGIGNISPERRSNDPSATGVVAQVHVPHARRVAVSRATLPVAARYLLAAHPLVSARRSEGLYLFWAASGCIWAAQFSPATLTPAEHHEPALPAWRSCLTRLVIELRLGGSAVRHPPLPHRIDDGMQARRRR
jgi:hypothetical protein